LEWIRVVTVRLVLDLSRDPVDLAVEIPAVLLRPRSAAELIEGLGRSRSDRHPDNRKPPKPQQLTWFNPSSIGCVVWPARPAHWTTDPRPGAASTQPGWPKNPMIAGLEKRGEPMRRLTGICT
jgi:hypothetical protein